MTRAEWSAWSQASPCLWYEYLEILKELEKKEELPAILKISLCGMILSRLQA